VCRLRGDPVNARRDPGSAPNANSTANPTEHAYRPRHRRGASRPTSNTGPLREGDTLKITRLDRIGRSVLHLVTLGAELRERGVGLHVIEQGIDTTTAAGRAMFGMLSVLAELQRELIVANTRDGLAAARAGGRKADADRGSTPSRSRSLSRSTTAGSAPSSRSQTSSAFPAPPSTGTSTPRAKASDPLPNAHGTVWLATS
jgi:hypothetical protein